MPLVTDRKWVFVKDTIASFLKGVTRHRRLMCTEHASKMLCSPLVDTTSSCFFIPGERETKGGFAIPSLVRFRIASIIRLCSSDGVLAAGL